MFDSIRRRLAEKLHPESNDYQYWIMKSLSREDVKLDVEELIKKHGKRNVRLKAIQLKDNYVFQHILDKIEYGESQYMTKEVKDINAFLYSRSIIHAFKTIREKLELFIKTSDDDIESFDRFDVM